MKLDRREASSAPRAVGGYAQALEVREATRWLFVSGQVPETAAGETPAGFRAQAERVWANLIAQLEAAGMGVANLVHVRTYLASRAHADLNAEVRRGVLGDHAPALTVIVCEIFDERWLLEIEAVAAA